MSSIFSKIVLGEIPAYKIAENEYYLAFLDAFPIAKGHTLVIPKKQSTDKLFHLERDVYNGLMDFSYTIAQAIEQVVPCNRIGSAVLGLAVPHAHVHLVPINNESDLSFLSPKIHFTPEEFEAVRKAIAEKISL